MNCLFLVPSVLPIQYVHEAEHSLNTLSLQLISDAGYQGEITSVSTACHQIEVFSRVLRTSISGFLEGGEEALEKHLPEFTVRAPCFYFLFCAVLLFVSLMHP